MEVVQMDVRGCLSSHSTTPVSGGCRMSAERTLVSRTIIDQSAQVWSGIHGVQGCLLRVQPWRTARRSPCQDLLQQHLVHLQHFGECPGLLPPCYVHAALRAAAAVPYSLYSLFL